MAPWPHGPHGPQILLRCGPAILAVLVSMVKRLNRLDPGLFPSPVPRNAGKMASCWYKVPLESRVETLERVTSILLLE